MEPVENLYFNWLCAKVIDNDSQSYRALLKILHETEFVWVVSADENRAADGVELRQDFLRETKTERDSFWEEEPCSIFEMLIAFAKRASFQTDIQTRKWFWEFIANLKLDVYRRASRSDEDVIRDILDAFIWRTHTVEFGYITILPLRRSDHEQKLTEIWYLFCEYIDERGLF